MAFSGQQQSSRPFCLESGYGRNCIKVRKIEYVLKVFGFKRTNPANLKNQRWVHPDRTEVQIHAYGGQKTTPYKAGNNTHVHKSVGKHGEPGTIEVSNDGLTQVSPHSPDAHIGIKKPHDYPTVSGRKHGE